MHSSTVRRFLVLLSAFSFLVFAGACKKKVAPAPPPAPAPAPAPAQPTVTISATSTSLQAGPKHDAELDFDQRHGSRSATRSRESGRGRFN